MAIHHLELERTNYGRDARLFIGFSRERVASLDLNLINDRPSDVARKLRAVADLIDEHIVDRTGRPGPAARITGDRPMASKPAPSKKPTTPAKGGGGKKKC